MAKLTLALLSYLLLSACNYDAGRLLRPADEPSAAGASRADTSADFLESDRKAATPDAGVAPVRDADGWGTDSGARDTGKTEDGGVDGISGLLGSASVEATFASGRAQGAMSGYGSVSLGVVDSVTTPTCGEMQIGGLAPSMPPVTFNSTCRPSAITWGTANGLCVSGSIPGWSARSSYMDYMIDWGIMVGVATREPVQAMGVSYRTITLTVSEGEDRPLFAVVHLADDANRLTYCASMRSGEAIKFSAFNTECLFNSGDRLALSDVEKIDKIGVQIPPSESAVTLSDFCLTKVELAK